MSVRSFTALCPNAPPVREKLSVILRGVQEAMSRRHSYAYICLTTCYVAEAQGLAQFEVEDRKERVSRFLQENGIDISGDWFAGHFSNCRDLWDDEVGIYTASSVAQRTARLAVLGVLIHQLEARGE